MEIDSFLVNNRILMLALDHRGSIEKMLPPTIAQSKRDETIVDIKKMLMKSLSPLYSGVLLDSDYGLPAYASLASQDASVLQKPFLLCIEKTGYTDTDHERLTTLEYSVAQLKEKGAKGVKILLFFHPDGKTAQQQIALTRDVYTQCQANGLPFFLEILNYSLDDKPYDPTDLVPRSVAMFLEQKITAEVFKLEFPGSPAACQNVTELLGNTPWILLTKGETYEKFKEGLAVASTNGARGFLAGRSIWQDFATLPQDAWEQFFATTVKERFQEISEIALA